MFFERNLIILVLIILLTAIEMTAQTPITRTPRTNIDPNRPDAGTQRWFDELKRRENVPTGIGSVSDTTLSLILKLRSNALKKLKPSEEDEKPFAEFLKQSDTGLLRLAAETDCAKILDITNPNLECVNHYIEGKAQAYSFRKNRYSHEAYADLERKNGKFVLPGTYVLGLMTLLGDVPIETINPTNENVAALAKFAPADEFAEVVKQDKELGQGLVLGNLTYRKALPIQENTTYLLRSVAYQAKFKNLPKSDKRKGSLDDDDRSDVIIVFRVVRKDSDGSLFVLWKELYRKDAPKIEVDLGN